MNQKKSFKPIQVAFFALLGIALSTGLLMGDDFSGAFTLPLEVRWGAVTLPPGDYTFKINPHIAPYTATVTGKNGTVYLMPTSLDDRSFSGRSSLVLARQGNKGVVRELHLAIPGVNPWYSRQGVRTYDRGILVSNVETRIPNQGVVFAFKPPKGELSMMARKPELIQRIPLLMASK